MKRVLALGLFVLLALPAASPAAPRDLKAYLQNGSAMTRGSLYWVAPGSCRFGAACQKLKRTDVASGEVSTVKETHATVTGLLAEGDKLAFSTWNMSTGRSVIYSRSGAGQIVPEQSFMRRKRSCRDVIVLDGVSSDGAIAWTRYLDSRCRHGARRFVASTYLKWPGETAQRLGPSESLTDFEFASATDPTLHPNAVSISGRRVLQWVWPRAILYDFVGGTATRLISDAGFYDWISPVALGPNGEVSVTRLTSKEKRTEVPFLRPDPADLLRVVRLQEPSGQFTRLRFCGKRIVTFNPYAGDGRYSVRDLAGTMISSIDLNATGGKLLIETILCDDQTLVVLADDAQSDEGERVIAVPLG